LNGNPTNSHVLLPRIFSALPDEKSHEVGTASLGRMKREAGLARTSTPLHETRQDISRLVGAAAASPASDGGAPSESRSKIQY